MSLPNINTQTNIPFGVIYANDLDPDLFSALLYDHSADMEYEGQVKEQAIQHGYDANKTDLTPHEWLDDNQIELDWETNDNYHEGEYQGVKFGVTGLGGAQMVYIYHSPFMQDFIACSPCVPNAHSIDVNAKIYPYSFGQRVEGKGYTCPKAWFYSDDQ